MAATKSASRSPATRGRKREPEEVKARILESGLTAFANLGYGGASVQRIARLAGVSVPLLIYHFQSKEKLWMATVEKAVSLFESRLAQLTSAPELSATERLRRIIVALVQAHTELPQFHRLMSHESHERTERLDWLCERFIKRHFELMTSTISAAQREGTVQPVAPERLSHAIVGMASIASQAAEFGEVAGRDLFSPAEMEKTIRSIYQLVFIDRHPAEGGESGGGPQSDGA